MHPLKDLCPLELIVFHVTKSGYCSLLVDGRRMKENRDDLDEALELSLKAVRLEFEEDEDGEDEDEALAGDDACNLEISLGLSTLLIGSASSSSSSAPSSLSPSNSSSSVISTSSPSSSSSSSSSPPVSLPERYPLYCSHSCSTCFKSRDCRFSRLAVSDSKQ